MFHQTKIYFENGTKKSGKLRVPYLFKTIKIKIQKLSFFWNKKINFRDKKLHIRVNVSAHHDMFTA